MAPCALCSTDVSPDLGRCPLCQTDVAADKLRSDTAAQETVYDLSDADAEIPESWHNLSEADGRIPASWRNLSEPDAKIPASRQAAAVYTLDTPARCPHCREPIRTVRVTRMTRTQVPFTSTLPRGGRVMACPQCERILSIELSTFG